MPNVGIDFRLNERYFLLERDLQDAGLLDFDRYISCICFSYLKVCIKRRYSGRRCNPPCFALLQLDFLETGFL